MRATGLTGGHSSFGATRPRRRALALPGIGHKLMNPKRNISQVTEPGTCIRLRLQLARSGLAGCNRRGSSRVS